MRCALKWVVLVTLLQAMPFACADDTNPISPVQDPAKHFLAHFEYLLTATQREKVIDQNLPPGKSGVALDMISASPNPRPELGVHWVMSDDRPALEYRFSNNGAVNFRLGRHGPVGSFGLNF